MCCVGYNYRSGDIGLALPHGGVYLAIKFRAPLAGQQQNRKIV